MKLKKTLSSVARKLKVVPIALVVLLCLQMSSIASMSRIPQTLTPHRYVQLEDGRTIEVKALPGSYRSDAVVARFAGDLISLAYKWDHTKRDYEANGVLYPTSYNMAALWLAPKARAAWANDFYFKYGPGMQGSRTGIDRRGYDYYPYLTQPPIVTQQREGVWKVGVKAMHFTVNERGQIIGKDRLGFELLVKAVNPNPSIYWDAPDPVMAKILERFWSDGLVVTEFVNLGG